ncbi:MAG: hypothetical protein ACE5Q6_26395, partial [Dehalococcoidia bacterium]
MAFPTVDATIQGEAAGPNPVLSLPTPVSAGDLLLAFVDHANNLALNFPSGWTELVNDLSDFNPGDGIANRFVVAYRDAAGGETTVTLSGGQFSGQPYVIHRISGHESPATQPPQAAHTTLGNSGSTNSPNLTPTGGAKDYLWFSAAGRWNDEGALGAPASYTNLVLEVFSTDNWTATSRRNLNAASEDPGAFTAGGSRDGTAVTVAVHPAPPVTAALSGTVTDDDESDIRLGGSTIILTLTNATWVAAGAPFDAQRQGIIDGLDSGQSEPTGWDAVLRPAIPVGNVVRTSDTVVTITLPVEADYRITENELVTATIPASATSAGAPIGATPSFTITNLAPQGVFPTIDASTSNNLAGSSLPFPLPTPVSAGDLLLAFFSERSGDTFSSGLTVPSPWVTLVNNVSNFIQSDGILHRYIVAYLDASGGETTVTLTASVSTSVAGIIHRITGHRPPSGQPPEATVVTLGNSGPSADPPSLSPTGGLRNYLWIANVGRWDDAGVVGAPGNL